MWYPGQNKRIALLSFFYGCRKAIKELIALTPEIDSDQTAMGLPPVTSAVILITNFGKTWASRTNIWDASAGKKREWYVCMYIMYVQCII
jgi:hypothetical protein